MAAYWEGKAISPLLYAAGKGLKSTPRFRQ
jgi:hypothetical protein